MQFLLDIFYHNLKELSSYVFLYLISLVALHFISKNKQKRELLINTLTVVKLVLQSKLGDKSSSVLDIWLEGLKKVEDGEFSNDDKVDQFLRYIKLISSQKGIDLSEADVETLHTLILSTFANVENTKPQLVTQSINKFSQKNKS